MWLLIVAQANATPALYTCNYGDLLSNIIGIARRQSEPVTMYVATDCTIDLAEITLDPSSYGVSEYTFVPEAASGTIELPPIAVTDGATLHLERITIRGASENLGLRDFGADLDLGAGAALYVDGATLEVDQVELLGAGGAGLVVVDGDVSGSALTATGYDAWRALYAVAAAVRTTVDLTEVAFEDNAAGAVRLWGATEDVSARFTDAAFRRNGPAGGADIASKDVAELVVQGGEFAGSTGATTGLLGGAPVYVDGGSFSCATCDFTDTTGDVASAIAAYLGAGDAVVLSEGEYAPATASETLMHIDSGGSFRATLLTVTGGGELRRYSGTTAITSSRFDAAGTGPDYHAIKLVGTTATLEGLTMCGYPDNGWALVNAYGATVEVVDSVFQSLALGGAPVIDATSAGTALDVHDNTMVGSDAVLVGGEPEALTFTNNLVAASTGGLALDATPGGAEVGWNLWYDVDEPVLGGAPGPDDVVDEDPRFVAAYDPTSCGSGPWLLTDSPANAAGDPTRPDIYGNPRSDIGAIDYDEGSDTAPPDSGDPGDSGATDTARPGDTGGDTDVPALVGGALPPCGCDDGGGAALVLLAPLIARRRRDRSHPA